MMAEKVIKCEISDTGYEDTDCLDKKLLKCETTTNISDLGNNSTKVEDCIDYKNCHEFSTVYIKSEFPSNVSVNGTPNAIEIKQEVSDSNINVEDKNTSLYCSNCYRDYDGYCTTCHMLVHILDNNTPGNKFTSIPERIPKNIVEVKGAFDQSRIYALKVIPEGVKFGPFTGLRTPECTWRIKGGKFISSANMWKYRNWMQYIKHAKDISECNLLPHQCDGSLYYHSIRAIEENEELLVYFGDEFEDKTKQDVEMTFTPNSEVAVKDVFACTFCCLGFSSNEYLTKHKTVCPSRDLKESLIGDSEIIQCQFCKVYLGKNEYSEFHRSYCQRKHISQTIQSASKGQTMEVDKEPSILDTYKKARSEMYKCSQCEYKTTHKRDLKSHADEHYMVKMYCCKMCQKEFEYQDALKLHFSSVHNDIKGKDVESYLECQYKCTKCGHVTPRFDHMKKHLSRHDKLDRFKCSQCDYQTYNKQRLKQHVDVQHSNVKHKCSKCGFETRYEYGLKKHMLTHEEVKRFKCSMCEFETNYNTNLKYHIMGKHTEKK